jgi:hypothetical protein
MRFGAYPGSRRSFARILMCSAMHCSCVRASGAERVTHPCNRPCLGNGEIDCPCYGLPPTRGRTDASKICPVAASRSADRRAADPADPRRRRLVPEALRRSGAADDVRHIRRNPRQPLLSPRGALPGDLQAQWCQPGNPRIGRFVRQPEGAFKSRDGRAGRLRSRRSGVDQRRARTAIGGPYRLRAVVGLPCGWRAAGAACPT